MSTRFPFTNLLKEKHWSARLNNSTSFCYQICLFCPRGFIIFLVRFWQLEETAKFAITALECIGLLVKHIPKILRTIQLEFRQDTVSQLENCLDSRINTTGLWYFSQLPPSLDGGLESQSVRVLFLLSLIALQRHWCDIWTMLERLHAHRLFYQQHVRRFFQIRAGITPQDVLTSIAALAIILCLKLTLFVATPLSKLQQYSWTTFWHCKYT